MNNLKTVFLLLLPAFLPGCNTYKTAAPAANYYYVNPSRNLFSVGRVAVVELKNNSNYPQISYDITDSLYRALQKKQVFGLSVIRQNDTAWRSLQLEMDSTYTLEQLVEIRKALKSNAVLVGTITEYQPYPHMVIGLRLKLVDLTDGQLLWALEQIWDSADKATECRVKNYFNNQMRSDSAALREQLVSVSSLDFIGFVTYEIAETLSFRK